MHVNYCWYESVTSSRDAVVHWYHNDTLRPTDHCVSFLSTQKQKIKPKKTSFRTDQHYPIWSWLKQSQCTVGYFPAVSTSLLPSYALCELWTCELLCLAQWPALIGQISLNDIALLQDWMLMMSLMCMQGKGEDCPCASPHFLFRNTHTHTHTWRDTHSSSPSPSQFSHMNVRMPC